MKNRAVIFYGASRNASDHIAEWIEKTGMPDCFADSDIFKQGAKFPVPRTEISGWGGVDILSLREAIGRFPDFELYVTLNRHRLPEITEFLLGQGVPPDRIKYCEFENVPRFCSFGGGPGTGKRDAYFLVDSKDGVGLEYSFCCATHLAGMNHCTNDIEYDFAHLESSFSLITEHLRLGLINRCTGCSSLKEGAPPPSDGRVVINLSTGLEGGDVCNNKCCYCTYRHWLFEGKPRSERADKPSVLDFIRFVERRFEPAKVFLNYASGELGCSKYRDEVLETWLRNGWEGAIATNATVYLDGVGRLLERGIIALIPSLDAGTRETYKKIKGVDLFDRVIANLRKYAERSNPKTNIRLKYILLEGLNDNNDEIESFCGLAKSISSQAVLAFNHENCTRRLSEKMIALAEYFAACCARHGIDIALDSGSVGKDDCDLIEALIREVIV
jgi:hypothetical protein